MSSSNDSQGSSSYTSLADNDPDQSSSDIFGSEGEASLNGSEGEAPLKYSDWIKVILTCCDVWKCIYTTFYLSYSAWSSTNSTQNITDDSKSNTAPSDENPLGDLPFWIPPILFPFVLAAIINLAFNDLKLISSEPRSWMRWVRDGCRVFPIGLDMCFFYSIYRQFGLDTNIFQCALFALPQLSYSLPARGYPCDLLQSVVKGIQHDFLFFIALPVYQEITKFIDGSEGWSELWSIYVMGSLGFLIFGLKLLNFYPLQITRTALAFPSYWTACFLQCIGLIPVIAYSIGMIRDVTANPLITVSYPGLIALCMLPWLYLLPCAFSPIANENYKADERTIDNRGALTGHRLLLMLIVTYIGALAGLTICVATSANNSINVTGGNETLNLTSSSEAVNNLYLSLIPDMLASYFKIYLCLPAIYGLKIMITGKQSNRRPDPAIDNGQPALVNSDFDLNPNPLSLSDQVLSGPGAYTSNRRRSSILCQLQGNEVRIFQEDDTSTHANLFARLAGDNPNPQNHGCKEIFFVEEDNGVTKAYLGGDQAIELTNVQLAAVYDKMADKIKGNKLDPALASVSMIQIYITYSTELSATVFSPIGILMVILLGFSMVVLPGYFYQISTLHRAEMPIPIKRGDTEETTEKDDKKNFIRALIDCRIAGFTEAINASWTLNLLSLIYRVQRQLWHLQLKALDNSLTQVVITTLYVLTTVLIALAFLTAGEFTRLWFFGLSTYAALLAFIKINAIYNLRVDINFKSFMYLTVRVQPLVYGLFIYVAVFNALENRFSLPPINPNYWLSVTLQLVTLQCANTAAYAWSLGDKLTLSRNIDLPEKRTKWMNAITSIFIWPIYLFTAILSLQTPKCFKKDPPNTHGLGLGAVSFFIWNACFHTIIGVSLTMSILGAKTFDDKRWYEIPLIGLSAIGWFAIASHKFSKTYPDIRKKNNDILANKLHLHLPLDLRDPCTWLLMPLIICICGSTYFFIPWLIHTYNTAASAAKEEPWLILLASAIVHGSALGVLFLLPKEHDPGDPEVEDDPDNLRESTANRQASLNRNLGHLLDDGLTTGPDIH